MPRNTSKIILSWKPVIFSRVVTRRDAIYYVGGKMEFPAQEIARRDITRRSPQEQGEFLQTQVANFMFNTKSVSSPRPQSDDIMLIWKADLDEMKRQIKEYEKVAE